MKMGTGTTQILLRIPNVAIVKQQTKPAITTTKPKHRTKPERLHSIYFPGKDVFWSKEISSVKYQLLCYITLRDCENHLITIKIFRLHIQPEISILFC